MPEYVLQTAQIKTADVGRAQANKDKRQGTSEQGQEVGHKRKRTRGRAQANKDKRQTRGRVKANEDKR